MNLYTGDTRQNVISTDKAFRLHDSFTAEDREAGWKQVGNLGSGCSQAKIDGFITHAKEIYLSPAAKK